MARRDHLTPRTQPTNEELNSALMNDPVLISDGAEVSTTTVNVSGIPRTMSVTDSMIPMSGRRGRARDNQRLHEQIDPNPIGYTLIRGSEPRELAPDGSSVPMSSRTIDQDLERD